MNKDLSVILDANFLMIPELEGVDIFKEFDRILDVKYELIVPKVVIGELEHIRKTGNSSESTAASVALKMAEDLKKVESEKPADDEIVRLAKETYSAVGTNDKELKKRLRGSEIPVIYLRQKSYLDIDGNI